MEAVLTFLFGLLVLLVAGNLVVSGASALGERFGLTPMVVGLTIVAAGTSAPELAVVGQSVAAGDTELAVGSVIGSNIANVLLVLGLAASVGSIAVTSRIVRIDIPVMIAASLTLLWMAQDRALGRLDGVLMLSALVVFVGWTLQATRGQPPDPRDAAAAPRKERPIWLLLTQLGVGVGGLAFAAGFVVRGAEQIAVSLGVPELIGLDRWEGFLFVSYYGAYVVFLILDATGHRAKEPFAFVMLAFVAPLTVLTVATIAVRQVRHRRLANASR